MTQAIGRTHPGRRRSVNEDALLVDPGHNLFLLADGMGGHQAGEVAAQMAVNTVAEFVTASLEDAGITWPYGLDVHLPFEGNQLTNGIQLANQRMFHDGRTRQEHRGMGSTIIAALIKNGRLIHASVGDSRLYLMRDGVMQRLTVDDSWASSMLRAGADPEVVRVHPMRHVLSSALGSQAAVQVRVSEHALEDGDLLMLCTDGLHGPVGEAEIARMLSEPAADLDQIADRLIQAANDAGGPDNVSVVLVRHAGNGRSPMRLADARN